MRAQHGFTLIAVLVAMVLLSLATEGVLVVVSQQVQRQRERELLDIGDAYVRAIRSYYEVSPGTVKRYPANFADLIEDHRFVITRRHLRELYLDPVNGRAPFEALRRADGTIEGIASGSDGAPIASAPIEASEFSLAGAGHYSDWHFVFRPHPIGPDR